MPYLIGVNQEKAYPQPQQQPIAWTSTAKSSLSTSICSRSSALLISVTSSGVIEASFHTWDNPIREMGRVGTRSS